jgi:prepilin-type processing-associated H-X9-DG protein
LKYDSGSPGNGKPLYHTQFDIYSNNVASLRPSGDIPLFFDATWIDIDTGGSTNGSGGGLNNGTPTAQPTHPTDLNGIDAASGPAHEEQGRFLIKRHGRAINICFVDGHATTVQLPDTYNQLWYSGWQKYSFTDLRKLP